MHLQEERTGHSLLLGKALHRCAATWLASQADSLPGCTPETAHLLIVTNFMETDRSRVSRSHQLDGCCYMRKWQGT